MEFFIQDVGATRIPRHSFAAFDHFQTIAVKFDLVAPPRGLRKRGDPQTLHRFQDLRVPRSAERLQPCGALLGLRRDLFRHADSMPSATPLEKIYWDQGGRNRRL
jgi:hypothetical protein